jgi:DNA polymerase-3 subunit gamma/tau
MAGQDHVVRALTHALEQGRLHHAYLFTGTRGIGKTTVSRILAKSLNCIGPDGRAGVTASPCGVCAPCREIDSDRHVDYIELDAASNRSIDEIRDLIERAAYKPTVGRFKVFMIDEAHQLTKDAFNALLKTLEEPPEYLKFVLATTDPERMLPTVLSRCLQFNLRPMPPEVVREHLELVLQAEGVAFDEGSLRLIGRAARGSMRDALSLTDQAIAYGGGQLVEPGVAAMLGLAGREACDDVLRALARRDGPAVVYCAQALREAGVPPASALEQMAQWLQQVALAQVAPGALDLEGPDRALLTSLAQDFASDEVQLLYSIVLHGRGELSLMSDEYAAFMMVLLRYLAFPGPEAARGGPSAGRVGDVPGARAEANAIPNATTAMTKETVPTPPLSALAMPAARTAALRIDVPSSSRPAVNRSTAVVSPTTVGSDVTPRVADHASAGVTHAASAVPAVAQSVYPGTPDLSLPVPVRGRASVSSSAPDVPAAAPPAAEFAASVNHAGSQPVVAVPLLPSLDRTQDEPGTLASHWDAVARQMSAAGVLSGLVRELAWQSTLVAIEQGHPTVWRLRVGHESLRGQALRSKLAEALGSIVGESLQVEVDAGDPHDTPLQRDTAERALRQQEAERDIREDPLVKDLLDRFASARIVPGSIRPL